MAALQSRYLGVQPFKTSDKHLFFGRDEDIENLLDTILLEKLIVLFGKSGYGKSSLLNAGIVPRLTDDNQSPNYRFRPIEVRFTTFVEGQSLPPIETMRRMLRDLPITEVSDFLQKLGVSDGLWGQFKQRQGVGNGQFVLIFDQFEEFFSYPLDQQEVFRKQLSELLYTDIPQSARARLGELTDAERRYLAQPMTIKAVFAIRSDRMSFLDSLKDTLPAILHKRYELKPLSIEQAKQAITQPALEAGDNFSSPNFEYTEGGLSAIIKALTTITTDGKETTTTGVEAFQLQIVCEYIESLVKDGKVPDLDGNGLPDITEAQLPEMSKLYENYYRRKLAELDPALQNAAQLVLEDGLLAEDSTTGEGRRMSVDSRALIAQFRQLGLNDALLLALEKTYLIRREMNTVGGFSFEISHDTLVAPIQKTKSERREKEAIQRAEQERLDKERQLTEAKAEAAKDRRNKYFAYGLSALAIVGLLFATWQYLIAKEANRSVVYMLMREADKNIYELNYNDALVCCQLALDIGVAEDSIKNRLLEIAFWQTETDAFGIAATTLSRLNINALEKREDLLAAIQKNTTPQYFDFLNERYYPKMIKVEGGEFEMGSLKYDDDAEPIHKVSISSYSISSTELSVWQYFLFANAKNRTLPRKTSWGWFGDNPIVNVDWYDCNLYSEWLTKRKNLKFRLPTEAEWEFAASGGVKSQKFIYSGSLKLSEVAWYSENSNGRSESINSKKTNELGIYGMTGNVWEWCQDWYNQKYYLECYKLGTVHNPQGYLLDTLKTLRGGSFNASSEKNRITFRSKLRPDSKYYAVGFRVVSVE